MDWDGVWVGYIFLRAHHACSLGTGTRVIIMGSIITWEAVVQLTGFLTNEYLESSFIFHTGLDMWEHQEKTKGDVVV